MHLIKISICDNAKPRIPYSGILEKPQHHRLVTTGVYSVLRHPSYCGWFWWSLGTQVLLANPVCFALYALLSWRFFRDRIPFEEATLGAFYPREYPSYRARTHVGIPFIS